jgi:TRAP transporter TAXI family solute receptor
VQAPEVESAVTIAAAITDARHRPIASLCAVVPLHRYDPARERWLGTQVRDAALRVSYLMGARLLGGASVGSWHDAIAVIAELLRRREPGLIVTPALGRGRRNLEDLAAGLGAYGLATAASLHDAYRGHPPYDRPLTNLRAVMNLSPLHLHIMLRPGLEVRSVADLYGLRVSPGEQDSSGGDAFSDLMRLGNERTKRRRRRGALVHLDYPEARRQFLAGNLDALVWLTALRNPVVRELETNLEARLTGIDDALLGRMVAANPGYRRGVIPGATYPRLMGADVTTLMVPTVLVCSADRPADEVHEVTRTVFEHRAELALIASVYRRLDASFALDGLTAPLHPGAQRYWQATRQKPAKVASAGS